MSVHGWAQSVVSFQRRRSTTKPVTPVPPCGSSGGGCTGAGTSLSLCSLNAGDLLVHQNAPESLHADAQQKCRSPQHKAHITKLHNKKQRIRRTWPAPRDTVVSSWRSRTANFKLLEQRCEHWSSPEGEKKDREEAEK